MPSRANDCERLTSCGTARLSPAPTTSMMASRFPHRVTRLFEALLPSDQGMSQRTFARSFPLIRIRTLQGCSRSLVGVFSWVLHLSRPGGPCRSRRGVPDLQGVHVTGPPAQAGGLHLTSGVRTGASGTTMSYLPVQTAYQERNMQVGLRIRSVGFFTDPGMRSPVC